MLWTFYVGFSHLPMSSGHHSTTRLAISVVSLQKAQCQAYLTSSFFFLSRFVERHRNSIPLCVSCSSGGNVKSKSNEVSGSQIVDWCTNAIRSSFLEFHVGRTKGRDNVYYLYWNIEMLIIGIVRTETATYVWTPQDWFRGNVADCESSGRNVKSLSWKQTCRSSHYHFVDQSFWCNFENYESDY